MVEIAIKNFPFLFRTYLNMSLAEKSDANGQENDFEQFFKSFDLMEVLQNEGEENSEKNKRIRNKMLKDTCEEGQLERNSYPNHDGIGPFNDVNLPGVWFYKMPHKVCFLISNKA